MFKCVVDLYKENILRLRLIANNKADDASNEPLCQEQVDYESDNVCAKYGTL